MITKGQTQCIEAPKQGGVWEGLYEPSLTPAKCNVQTQDLLAQVGMTLPLRQACPTRQVS
jgi:hypothetical protein